MEQLSLDALRAKSDAFELNKGRPKDIQSQIDALTQEAEVEEDIDKKRHLRANRCPEGRAL